MYVAFVRNNIFKIVLLSYDVFILTDTWLTKDFTNAEVNLDGYITSLDVIEISTPIMINAKEGS